MTGSFDLTGRTAVVTGASSGLGVTVAKALADAGADVVLGARRTDRLHQVARTIEEAQGTAVVIPCDVAEPADVDRLIAGTVDRFGRVDILVNNAGTAADAGPMPERLAHDSFEYVLRVNLLGTWYACREAGARMLSAGGGSIINVASAACFGSFTGFPVAYTASKAAVVTLTRSLAVNWSDRGVRVNAIAPGWFPSEMTAGYLSAPACRDYVLSQQPMARLGEPHELVGALLFLASDASSYVSGHTLVVDGGMSASVGAPRYGEEQYAFHAAVAPGSGERIMPRRRSRSRSSKHTAVAN